MNRHFVLGMGLLLGSMCSQAVDMEKWNAVDVLCGKLVQVEKIPKRGVANSFREKTKVIKKAALRLYYRDKDVPCCAQQSAAAEGVSTKNGTFEFKNIATGNYWLVARVGGTDYKLALKYQPDSKHASRCSEMEYTLKDGEFQLLRIVVVD
jgi:hypothetical protein